MEETKEALIEKGKTLLDIEWIGGEAFRISKEDFLRLADVEYDNGHSWQDVPKDLVMVGKDFWFERAEYDGSEWWEMKKMPVRPEEEKTVAKLTGGFYDKLEHFQEKEL